MNEIEIKILTLLTWILLSINFGLFQYRSTVTKNTSFDKGMAYTHLGGYCVIILFMLSDNAFQTIENAFIDFLKFMEQFLLVIK